MKPWKIARHLTKEAKKKGLRVIYDRYTKHSEICYIRKSIIIGTHTNGKAKRTIYDFIAELAHEIGHYTDEIEKKRSYPFPIFGRLCLGVLTCELKASATGLRMLHHLGYKDHRINSVLKRYYGRYKLAYDKQQREPKP